MADSPKRRDLEFHSLEEAVQEVEQLATKPTHTTGNYSFPQIVDHLAHAFDISSGHASPPPMPWLMRVILPFFLKRLVSKPLQPGVRLPKKPQDFFWENNHKELEPAMAHFREAYDRYRSTDPLPRHPLFGDMDRSLNEKLQCRHMALHLSFVHPEDG